MKVSRKWLQKYFDTPLPDIKAISDASTFHAFEVEEIISDDVIDLKVLPDRAGYALSHRGIASELSAILNIPFKDPLKEALPVMPASKAITVSVDTKKCARYIGAYVTGVTVKESPEWLKQALEAVGQRSINNVVDATNYVMLNIGQPLHAFDAGKSGMHITVRESLGGEKFTALGNTVYDVPAGALVISNGKDVLGLAGIKGGTAAEITSATTDIIIESANFDGTAVRRTAQALKLFTDSSLRFQNRPSPEVCAYGMRDVANLILEIAGGSVEGVVDVHTKLSPAYKVGVSRTDIVDRLGSNYTDQQIKDILNKLQLPFEEVESPAVRMCERAETMIGKPYKLGASVLRDAPDTFDCSSFTSWLCVQAGITSPRVSGDQFVWGMPIEEGDLKPGDLIFANTNHGHVWHETHEYLAKTPIPEGVDHVGLYVGDGNIIHATGGDIGTVVKENLKSSTRFNNIVGYRRVHGAGSPRYVVTVPFYRSDIRIKEDLVEEIGRIADYKFVDSKLLSVLKTVVPTLEDTMRESLRDALVADGFDEVSTYVFQDVGDVEMALPLADDKKFLRANLAHGHRKAAALNFANLPLFGKSELKMFEVGNVWPKGKEVEALAITIVGTKKGWEKERDAYFAKFTGGVVTGNTLEIELSKVTSDMFAHVASEKIELGAFKPFSQYPFVLRDIALWAPQTVSSGDIYKVLHDVGGEIFVRADLFDTFTKGDKTSYAFHIVFQSMEKTLTDAEVSAKMESIYERVRALGCEVR